MQGKAGQRAPEDPNQNSSPSAEDIEKSARFGRIIQNDLENIPLGLILLWAATVTYIISAGSNPQIKEYAQAIMAFAIIFAVARLLHTIVYGIAGPQPIRGALFLTGQLSALALGIISVILASKIPMQSDIVDPPSS